tara:strand:+ start:106 stop:579 length:474 start_codon:yes stop_codon:yes gene_type:complete
MEKDYLVNGFLLDLECVIILTKFNDKNLLNKTTPIYLSLRKNLVHTIKKFNVNTITEHEVADLYINRHLNFFNTGLIYNQKSIPKVKGNNYGLCQFPDCNFNGALEKDHILPKSSYSNMLDKFFDIDENSLLLCKVHNQVIKKDSIGIGLVLRNFLK